MPVSIIHKTSADNKGSSSKYGFYLNKENQEYIKDNQAKRQQFFFNQSDDKISTLNAICMIDDNTKGKGLKTKQDRYFTLTLNFSDKELKHLAEKVSGKRIKNVNELSTQDYIKYNQLIQNYTKQAMKNYADNFNKNLSNKDIVWHAKIEHKRRYKGYEKEVEKGLAKSGELKQGLNSHVHITVSRMHKDYRISLSPLATARNSKNSLKNKKVQVGFDRSNWKQLNEDSFDKMFSYRRDIKDKYQTLRTLKRGSFEEKEAIKEQINRSKTQNKKQKSNEITL